MKLSLVIPTYNEKGNVQKLIEKIQEEFKENKIDGEIIIVDDNSPDGTGRILENLKKKTKNLIVVHREGKLGLSSAVLEGWKMGSGEIFGVMDADLSHPVEKIHELYNPIKNGDADFTIGSRYVKDGKIENWNFKRRVMSKTATYFSRPFTNVRDPMSGFFMIRKDCVNFKDLNSKGFKLLLEIILKSKYKHLKEIPITFTDRTLGKSKAGKSEIIFYLENLCGYKKYVRRGVKEFFKFSLVGLIGAVINLGVLYLLTEYVGIYYLFSAIVAFVIAMTHNFFLNKVWTFGEEMKSSVCKKYIKFSVISIFALIVNLIFLYFFTEIIGIYYLISQVLAIGISLMINFFGNKFLTFKK